MHHKIKPINCVQKKKKKKKKNECSGLFRYINKMRLEIIINICIKSIWH